MRGEYRGGETIDQCVYISDRDAPTTLGEKENSVENSTGNSGKAEFSGVKGSIFILFFSFCASQEWVETSCPFFSVPREYYSFKFCMFT